MQRLLLVGISIIPTSRLVAWRYGRTTMVDTLQLPERSMAWTISGDGLSLVKILSEPRPADSPARSADHSGAIQFKMTWRTERVPPRHQSIRGGRPRSSRT
jgi:hypothetical protein